MTEYISHGCQSNVVLIKQQVCSLVYYINTYFEMHQVLAKKNYMPNWKIL